MSIVVGWYFDNYCGGASMRVSCSYNSSTGRINVTGCFGNVNISNSYPSCTNTHRFDVVSKEINSVVITDLSEYIAAVNLYSIATRTTSNGTKSNLTVDGSVNKETYLDLIKDNETDFELWYVDYCSTSPSNWSVTKLGNITVLNSSIPDVPETPVITIAQSCISDQLTNRISLVSSDWTDVDYFSVQKNSGSTYVEVLKIYSGDTEYYDDTSDVAGYYKIEAVNTIWNVSSNIVYGDFIPIIEASVIFSDYPTLTFTAETTNWCADVDYVKWYLDGTLTGTTTGATFTSVLPQIDTKYTLTTKWIKDSITGNTSNEVDLTFYYTGYTITCITGNTSLTISTAYNRMDYIIVAGGGGGGYLKSTVTGKAGGGGAGGMLDGTVKNPSAGTYTVIVGAGSSGGNTAGGVNRGGNSSFYGLTAYGGGKGGSNFGEMGMYPGDGFSGGSGGGGCYIIGFSARPGGVGISGHGNNGGSATTTRGGGGGGKTSAGTSGSAGGAGGAGKTSSISGTLKTYSVGGGTRTTNGNGASATPNTGNGGQGSYGSGVSGGNGGSGIVCVKLYNYFPSPPIAPSNLASSLIDCDSLRLTWTNNDTTEVTAIHVQQYSGSSWVTIHDVTSGATTYTVTGLTPSTEYQYRVVAYNDLYSTPSNEILPTTLDATPFNVSGIINNLEASVSWSINDTGYGIAIYPMIRVSGDTTWITGSTLAKDAIAFTFTGLSFNTDYEVQIVRKGSYYTSDIFEFSTADFEAPTINGYRIDTDVTLEIFDDNDNKEFYEIYRDRNGTGFTLVDTINYSATTWTDTGIASGVTYHYKVRCKLVTDFDAPIYSDYSNEITAIIIILIGASGLTASDITYTGLTLTWINNNVSGVTGNSVQQIIGAAWTTIASLSSGATTYDVTGLTPNTSYHFRIRTSNDTDEVFSAALNTNTLNPTPYGLTATTITFFYQDIVWELLTPALEDYIRIEYRICDSGSVWSTYGIVAYNDTAYRLSGLTMGTCYEIRVVTHNNDFGDYPSISFDLEIPAPDYPSPFCEGTNFAISGSTCGNADGIIQITNQEYLLYYDFSLVDVTGGTYSLYFDMYSGLTSGYYFLSATAKADYKWYYGYDACIETWIEIIDSDTPMFLQSVSVKTSQCGPFDYQSGRIYYNVSGLTSGHTYSFYAFTTDLSLYYTATGVTATTEFLLSNTPAQCYWVIIHDETDDCTLLISNKCVPSVPIFSQGGIKKLYLAKWNSDLDYNYWSDTDEDFFLEFEDTSFFYSTKIKEYLSLTGGTTGITWYELPVANKIVKLGQRLDKVRQGMIFTDTLSIAIAKYDSTKWTAMANLINPENKWIYIMQDADGFWWTGGHIHGARITAYNFKSGARGEDDGCTLELQAVSENKLLVNIDENYVINYVK